MNTLDIAHEGFSRTPKTLNHTFLYNDDSGELFDAACKELPFYIHYNDLAILVDNAARIAELAGKNRTLVEYGSGLCEKSFPLIEAFKDLDSFVAVDIDKEVLKVAEREVTKKYPDLKFHSFVGDIFKPMELPPGTARVALLACSMVGVFTDEETVKLLKCCMDSLGEDGVLLASYDTNKNPETVLPAYTTPKYNEFMLSVCDVINKEYGANLDKSAFKYKPSWNPEKSQVEHNLVAQSRQVVNMDGKEYIFEEGEALFVYPTRKRSTEEFLQLARKAGATVKHNFFDKDHFICFSWIEKEKQ